jgi:hypothetical protein
MNLGQVVDQAQRLVGEIDGIDPETIAGTLPREQEVQDDAPDDQHDPPHPAAPE